ncbi:MAG: hydrogen peroxide-inducible genes activator [Pseudomonadota bacterium]
MLPKLRQLEYLNALVEHRSFVRAAEACFVTQSTLSAGIKELEELLGQPVIDRSIKKVTLTPFGQDVHKDGQAMLKQAGAIVEKAQILKDPLAGPLRLGIIPTIAPYALPGILPVFEELFPKMELHIHEDLTARLLESLHNGEIDAALMAFPYPVKNLQSAIIKKERFVAAIAKGQMMAQKTMKLNDLKNHKVLLLEDGHCLRDHALAACALSPKETWQTFRASSLPSLIEMVRHGYGITLLPDMAAESGLGNGLDLIPFEYPAPTRDIGLCWRPSGRIHAISDTVMEALSESLSTHEAIANRLKSA